MQIADDITFWESEISRGGRDRNLWRYFMHKNLKWGVLQTLDEQMESQSSRSPFNLLRMQPAIACLVYKATSHDLTSKGSKGCKGIPPYFGENKVGEMSSPTCPDLSLGRCHIHAKRADEARSLWIFKANLLWCPPFRKTLTWHIYIHISVYQ